MTAACGVETEALKQLTEKGGGDEESAMAAASGDSSMVAKTFPNRQAIDIRPPVQPEPVSMSGVTKSGTV